ncbi:hypothetical protein [Caulobacter sp. NIBR1757]|uniref:hypothetical protein n=1 Tax=Caulobacter sp. NIBR1757 TaxID=3016000 RepID=UPI0022F0F757|nr:hypothetical protein [Caulobacter sp. NIBR1757]WGM40370.1 hypothetical protein AMEJIAPC_03315 [Caulobacter sp. NIBR1757]
MLNLKIVALGILRYLVLLMAVGPIIGVILVWTWMAVHGLSPDRNEIYDRGNLIMGLMMLTAGIGIALELIVTPMLRADIGRRHWLPRKPR